MARFIDLSEQDRIQYIKDGFVQILELLAKDPSKLKNYIKLEKPKYLVASLEQIKETMTDEEKKSVEARNKVVQEKVDAENAKLELEFKSKEENYKKAENVILKLQKKTGCVCGMCISPGITNNAVPSALEALIDVARKEAEERSY